MKLTIQMPHTMKIISVKLLLEKYMLLERNTRIYIMENKKICYNQIRKLWLQVYLQ